MTWETWGLVAAGLAVIVLVGLAVVAWSQGEPTPAVGLGIGAAIGIPAGAIIIARSDP